MCGCLDLLMWTRLLVELQARRIVELEACAQRGAVTMIDPGVRESDARA